MKFPSTGDMTSEGMEILVLELGFGGRSRNCIQLWEHGLELEVVSRRTLKLGKQN